MVVARMWGLAVACTILTGCGARKAEAPQPPMVQTMVVGSQAATGASLTGTVQARIESDIAFRIPGKIVARSVEAGQAVRRGQPLARLDPADYALASAGARSQAEAARAEYKRAQDDVRRFTPLLARGFVTGRSFDAARAEADAAGARLRAAEANARSLGNQSGYAGLFADADGIVTAIAAEPGQVVTAGQPVVRLARNGPRDVVVAVPEDRRGLAGRPAIVTIYGDARRYPAKLHSLAGAADSATRSYQARYEIEGGVTLPLGATATVLLEGEGPQRIAVPLGALHDGGRGPGVWVVGADKRVTFRPVRVAALGDESADIAAGLKGGERIVVLGAHLLEPGQAVRIAAAAK
ncbi:MAG: hypothetical protein JWR77_597 [Rhizorhabdus sp.]|nr:hypothetical protein [Rhizorhabdus sp.]